jgi:pimeloyl-ACP methyl ester carboxylesterase
MRCAALAVPIDYADPAGGMLRLAVARLAGKESTGSLVINPGGPGISGLASLAFVNGRMPMRLTDALDLVGFDPRGVGLSAPIDCLDNAELDRLEAFDADGSTAEGLAAAAAMWEEFALGCAEKTGPLLAHVDSVSAARDLDVLRAALGEEQLTYLGFSYGTYLGATYAALFPARVGRMVLDGGVDPKLTPFQENVEQAGGFESALRAYATYCLGLEECPLMGSVDEAMARIGAVLNQLRSRPPGVAGGRVMTANLAFSGVRVTLNSEESWPYLTDALVGMLEEENPGLLLELADVSSGRGPDGVYASNSVEALWAITCADGRGDPDPAAMRAEAEEIARAAPTVWRHFSWKALRCEAWPYPAAEPPASWAAKGAAPIVVIGTTNDPATPYVWSQRLADTLDSAVLVTREGEGHCGYLRGSTCVDPLVTEYLLDGVVPRDGSVCTP